MKHYCNPLNIEYRYQFYRKISVDEKKEPFRIFREAADPSLIEFKGSYYLFPSMTAGFFTSTDLHTWEFHEFLGEIPIYDYAPDVRVIGEYMYFSASKMGENCSFYRTKDPCTECFEEIPGTFSFWDPNLFVDDDGKVYFYWGCSNQEPIYGVELDPKTMHPLTDKKIMFDSNPDIRGYERFGEEHQSPKSEEQIEAEVEEMLLRMKKQAEDQNTDYGMSEDAMRKMLRGYFGNLPYIEGAWMTKYRGKYYLQYAIPGTEYNVYGDGVYISDKPLGPYYPAENNPYSYKPEGFLTGAGHGSTLIDKRGDVWHIATARISHNYSMERRIGLWKAGFDADGELYCDQRYGDWPVAMNAKPFEKPDWMLLSYGKEVKVSSGEGKEALVDEDIRTFWKASGSEPGEWACIDLGLIYPVSAIQINFADDGMTCEELDGLQTYRQIYEERYLDLNKQRTRWLLEGSVDGERYFVLKDKREAETDLSHDFIEFEEKQLLRYIRLQIEELPYHQTPAVSGIRVFGKGNEELPKCATNVIAEYNGKLDMKICWEMENAVGAVVLWGHEENKLYHSRMVYGKEETVIGALVSGQKIYIRVDTFNENGISEGKTVTIEDKNDSDSKKGGLR